MSGCLTLVLFSHGRLLVLLNLSWFLFGYRGQPSTTARLTQGLFHFSGNRLLTTWIIGHKGFLVLSAAEEKDGLGCLPNLLISVFTGSNFFSLFSTLCIISKSLCPPPPLPFLPFLSSGKPKQRDQGGLGVKGWKAGSLLPLGANGRAHTAPLTQPNYLTRG